MGSYLVDLHYKEKQKFNMAERVQVQGIGGAVPGISPTIQRGGQYSVQVQQAGRNKLMDLADALGQVNPILQQYGQLQKVQEQIGVEEAELIEEQNVTKELKRRGGGGGGGFDPLARFNRDRAFRDTLLKRHINNTMLPNLNLKAQDLIDAEKYKTTEEFSNALEASVNEEWEGLVGEVGEGLANTTAGKALWGSVTAPYKNKLRLKYEEAKDGIILDNNVQELGLNLSIATKPIIDPATGRVTPLDTSNLQSLAEIADERLSEDLPQLSKADRSKTLVAAYATQLDNLYASQRYTDASRMLAVMRASKVNGVPLFNTTQAKSVLNPIEAKLNNKLLSLDEKRDTKVGKRFANKVVTVLGNIKNIEEREQLSNVTAEEIKDTFVSLNPNLTPEQLDAEVETLFNGTSSPVQLYNQRLRELANKSGDEGEHLYYENVDDIRDGYETALKFPFDPIPLTKPNRDKIVEEFVRDYGKTGNDATDFLREKYNNQVKLFPELRIKSEELTAGDYVKDQPVYTGIKGRLTSDLKLVDAEFEDDDLELDYGNFLGRAEPAIQKKLEVKAKELAGTQYDETRDRTLQALADELILEEKEGYKGIVEAKAVSSGIEAITEEQVEKIKPSREKGGLRIAKGDIKYASLDQTKARKKQSRYKAGRLVATSYTSGKIDRSLINEEREQMIKNRDTNDLKLSLVRFGFEEYTPNAAFILEKARLDFMDVRLFGSVQEKLNVIGTWRPVLNKDARNEDLSPEEKKIRDEFQSFGVFDDNTMFQFISSQETFLND